MFVFVGANVVILDLEESVGTYESDNEGETQEEDDEDEESTSTSDTSTSDTSTTSSSDSKYNIMNLHNCAIFYGRLIYHSLATTISMLLL